MTSKRKLDQIHSASPPKRQKIDPQYNNEEKSEEIDFSIIEAPNATLQLLTKQASSPPIISNINSTNWEFEFNQLNDDNIDKLSMLFDIKLADWKRFINKNKLNNFVCIIKDSFGIWRAACLFMLYQLNINNNEYYLLKIPLTGVDLHFRRQGLGTLLIEYLVSLSSKYLDKEYYLIVLAIDEDGPKKFWNKIGFNVMESSNMKYKDLFNMKLMINKKFIIDSEDELTMMNYDGEKCNDLILKSETLKMFKKPKYVNFEKKYAKKEEIEEIEKHREENPELYKEYDEKLKELKKKQELVGDEDEEEDDDDDDEYVCDEDDIDEEYDDEDDDVDE